MDFLTCAIINGPFAILNIMVNLFYVFCMLCPPHGERIKQPQKLLLGSGIFCTVTYLLSALLLVCVDVTAENLYLILTLCVMFAWNLCTSMGSSVWLNFFYCTQIVPAQRALFMWIKKNIKHIIYCVWLLESIFRFLSVGVMVIDYLASANLLQTSHNVTVHTCSVCVQIPYSVLQSYVYKIAVHIVQLHFLLHACTVMLSSSSTVIYLCKHALRMRANGQSLSCPRFRGQVRVTLIGILQGILFFFCSLWAVYKACVRMLSGESLNLYIYFTLINLYTTGSSFTRGAGQSVFRRRFEGIWLRVTQVIRPMLPRCLFPISSDDAECL